MPQEKQSRRLAPEEQHLRLISGLHTHMHTPTGFKKYQKWSQNLLEKKLRSRVWDAWVQGPWVFLWKCYVVPWTLGPWPGLVILNCIIHVWCCVSHAPPSHRCNSLSSPLYFISPETNYKLLIVIEKHPPRLIFFILSLSKVLDTLTGFVVNNFFFPED